MEAAHDERAAAGRRAHAAKLLYQDAISCFIEPPAASRKLGWRRHMGDRPLTMLVSY
jgi:hypothetical protein